MLFKFDSIKDIKKIENELKSTFQNPYREHDGRLVPQSGIYKDIPGKSELEQSKNPLHAKPDSYYQRVYGCSCEKFVKRKTLKR